MIFNKCCDSDFDELVISALKQRIILFDIIPDDTIEFDIILYGHDYKTTDTANGNIMLVK